MSARYFFRMRRLKTLKLPRLAAPAPVCVKVRDIASSLCSEEQLLNSVGVTVTPQAPLQPPWSCEHINEIQFKLFFHSSTYITKMTHNIICYRLKKQGMGDSSTSAWSIYISPQKFIKKTIKRMNTQIFTINYTYFMEFKIPHSQKPLIPVLPYNRGKYGPKLTW